MGDKTQTAPNNTEQALLQSLSPEHLAMLREESGISDEVILARGYRTITDKKGLEALGFSHSQCRVPGLLLPLHTTDGKNTLYVYRPDNPRVIEEKRKGKLSDGTYPCKVIKYEVPKGAGTRVDCPPVCRPMLADPSTSLWISEGQKKADSLASRGLCAIALLGVWNWKGKNDVGGTTFLADWDYIALDNRDVRIVFDSDVMTKREVCQALDRLTEHLQRRKAHVSAVYLPTREGSKVGVDDWLVEGHTVEDLENLAEAPRPEPKAAKPIYRLLDDAPPTLRRPLALVNGQAYATIWPYVEKTVTESVGKKGEIIKHDPPIVKTAPELHIVRDDGAVFGLAGKSLDELGFEICLNEMPRPDRLWSTAGVRAYQSGERPDAADVFGHVVDVVNRFIDFSRSLADQQSMAEMVACYALSTWFLPAFNVVGYLWPNGDRGSGKTVLLHVIAEMSYLGQVILAGGSYASLRDLADYGATLAFDDAENLSDPRKSDPDKRALLLAGNRRGAIVTVKEPGPGKTWRTRHIDAFCPRLFSAISLPDDVLASRAIIIPLIRTPDRYRANADPLDYEAWPHDHQQLVDDLWALTLAHLPKLKEHDKVVSDKAHLTGRNLDPWRAILAVADWLNANGVEGLWKRMDALSLSYQDERPDLELSDLTSLLIRTLCSCAHDRINPELDISDVFDISDIKKAIPDTDWCFLTSALTDRAVEIAEQLELDISTEYVTSRRVGRILGKMRLERDRESGTGRRMWRATWGDLERWTTTYAISLPEAMSLRDFGFSPTDTLSCNVTNVNDVTNVKEDNDLSANGTDGMNGTMAQDDLLEGTI